jgi:hypothetical protein
LSSFNTSVAHSYIPRSFEMERRYDANDTFSPSDFTCYLGATSDDEWVITRLEFFDKRHLPIVPKKGFSTGAHQNFEAHNNVLFKRQDGYTYNYDPLNWKGQSYNGDIFIGGTFMKNVEVHYVHVTHQRDPISRLGEPKTICIEYWNGRFWIEYPQGSVTLKNVYAISHFEEKKFRELAETKTAVKECQFGPDAPLTDSAVSYYVNRTLIEPSSMWRITCEDNAHWAWDVKSLNFFGLDNAIIRPCRVFSSGHFTPEYSANQAVYNMGNIWAGHKDSSGLFYIGCEFDDDILLSHVEISQPYSINMRSELFAESFDFTSGEWVRIARYAFHKHFIKRGPIALPIINRHELSILGSVNSVVPFGESSIRDDMTDEREY